MRINAKKKILRSSLLVLLLFLGMFGAQAPSEVSALVSTGEFRIVGKIPDLDVDPPKGEVVKPGHEIPGTSGGHQPLPQTGERASGLLVALGYSLLALMMWLVFAKRRRRHDDQ